MCEKWLHISVCVIQVKTVEINEGLLEDRFAPSVKMSTYLVAFVTCDFKSVTAKTSSGVQVWTEQQYLIVLIKILLFLSCYF